MSENNFLPYEINKKRYLLRNRRIKLLILALSIINIFMLIRLSAKVSDYNSRLSIIALNKKEASGEIKYNKNTASLRKLSNTEHTLALIDNTSDDLWKDAEINEGTVNLSVNQKDLQPFIENLSKIPLIKIKRISKTQDSDTYTLTIEVKNNEN